jgi:hypothetical protein
MCGWNGENKLIKEQASALNSSHFRTATNQKAACG